MGHYGRHCLFVYYGMAMDHNSYRWRIFVGKNGRVLSVSTLDCYQHCVCELAHLISQWEMLDGCVRMSSVYAGAVGMDTGTCLAGIYDG